MKTVEQTRRELFEASMDKVLCDEGYSDFSLASMMERGTQGQYYSSRIAGAWEGFNAALDAVVIELPEVMQCGDSQFNSWEAMDADQVRTAIKSTGLGIKIK